jgi:uroporphyrin-III C-methyltransferase / precorrin-2 dehydrogenase / sirohydrochlorin ferrochelatase
VTDDARLHSLPLFVRLAGRPVILVGTGEAADAKRRLLERAGAEIVGEAATAALAIVAVEEPGASGDRAAEGARRAGQRGRSAR